MNEVPQMVNLGLSRPAMTELFYEAVHRRCKELEERGDKELDIRLSATLAAILDVIEANNKQILADLQSLPAFREEH